MTELASDKELKQEISKESKTRVRSSLFKYYIHDGPEVWRFQLIGELTASEVSELDGCWRTARGAFGTRKLVLDVTGLKAVDEPGREWLISLANEGAALVPENYLRQGLAAEAAKPEPAKPGFFCRLFSTQEQ